MAISTAGCRNCGHRHSSPVAGVDGNTECFPYNVLHDCAVWQCPANISLGGPVAAVIGDDLHGSTDCKVTGDPDCYNDGLCCHDATSLFECPWERGEYPAWADETETRTTLGVQRTETVVSEYQRRTRRSCLAHEAFDEDRLRGWVAGPEYHTQRGPCPNTLHQRYDKHLSRPTRKPMSEALWAGLTLHQPTCINFAGDPRQHKSDIL